MDRLILVNYWGEEVATAQENDNTGSKPGGMPLHRCPVGIACSSKRRNWAKSPAWKLCSFMISISAMKVWTDVVDTIHSLFMFVSIMIPKVAQSTEPLASTSGIKHGRSLLTQQGLGRLRLCVGVFLQCTVSISILVVKILTILSVTWNLRHSVHDTFTNKLSHRTKQTWR